LKVDLEHRSIHERTDQNHVERTDGSDAYKIDRHIGDTSRSRLHRDRRIRVAAASAAALLRLTALPENRVADGERDGADQQDCHDTSDDSHHEPCARISDMDAVCRFLDLFDAFIADATL
jgi:hypothetical protein